MSVEGGLQRRLGQALDRVIATGTPKYVGLRDAIMELIRTGHWPPGAKLPPEQRLTALTGLSLGTVQRALRILTDEGVLERTQGRGTFVTGEESALRDPWHFRFLGEDDALLPVYTKVVGRAVVRPETAWARSFRGSGSFIELQRTLDVNREFSCFNRFYLDALRFERFATMPLAKLDGTNIKDILRADYGLSMQRLRHRLGVAPVDREVAQRIGVAAHSICLVMEIFAFATAAEPVYYQVTYVPPSPRRLAPLDIVVRAG